MSQNTTLNEANQLIRQGRTPEAIKLLESDRIRPQCAVRLRELYLGEHRNDLALPIAKMHAVGSGAEAHVSRSVVAMTSGDLETAVAECEYALQLEPRLASAFNHLGRALQNSGHSLQALSALRKAVEIQDDYPEAWYNLGLILRASGSMDEAMKAYRKALDWAPGYRAAEFNLGISLMLIHRVDEALYCFDQVLERYPDDVETLVNRGLALHTLGRVDAARASYDRALELDPDNALGWCYLGILLHECLAIDEARDALERSLQLDPTDVEAWVELASIHEQSNRLDEAREALRHGARAKPRHPALLLETARLHRRDGQHEQAFEVLDSLPTGALPQRLAQQVHFERGQVLDRLERYDEAMADYQAGNRLLADNPRRRFIDPEGFERRCWLLENWLKAGAPGASEQPSDPMQDRGGDLCFLVGFPRSGTTLLDTMLDAHPDITSLEELPTIEKLVEHLAASEGGYPGGMADLRTEDIADLRSRYREECAKYITTEPGQLIVDKLPLRLLNMGLVHRVFPEARILFALRHPCDVVLSNFMQSYAANEAFIHFDTLQDSAATYDRVLGLWHQLETLLPLNLLYTRYEDMVADERAEMAKVCEFLGVQPVEAMFDAGQRMSQRSLVRTTSYQQVVEPVYRRSVERWQNYRTWMEPVLPVLKPWVDTLGYGTTSLQ